MLHPYHCVLCGTQLEEIGLGILICPQDQTQFLPSLSPHGKYSRLEWLTEEDTIYSALGTEPPFTG